MCGKFTQMMSWQGVHDLSDLIGQPAGGAEDYTTPMRFADVIRLDASGKRETARMRWGFAELRSKTPLDRPGHMHTRAETIDELPTFRGAFERARGIVLTKTFNIGEDLPNGRTRQWTVTPRDGRPVPLGVIWERWINRETELLTFVMVTVPANTLLSSVTDRMPFVLRPEQWAKWLGEELASLTELKAMLIRFDGEWTFEPQPLSGSRSSKAPRADEPTLF